MSRGEWQRVSKQRPCPVCGKPDWCLFSGPESDPTAVICTRIESEKRAGNGGWLHKLRTADDWRPTRRRTVKVVMEQPNEKPIIDFGAFARQCYSACLPQALGQFAESLGLTRESLERLQVGWSRRHNGWTFPMRDAAGGVTGIRLRLPSGKKLSVKGGKEGLFIPDALLSDTLPEGAPLLIAEGATDCAALWGLAFFAVGRPSCTGGIKHLVGLVRRLKASDVVIMADDDEPGQRGAESLAAVLLAYSAAVRIVTLPAKDVRAWLGTVWTGASGWIEEAAEVLTDIIDAAPVRRLNVTTQRRPA